jgi:hypothetical protein
VENDEYAKELSRDIHLNPARAKRVAYPGDYPGSSFGVYCGEKEAQDFIDFIKKKLKTNANVQQSRPDPTQLIQIRFTRVPSAINRVAELSILFFTFPITLASQFNYSLVSTFFILLIY